MISKIKGLAGKIPAAKLAGALGGIGGAAGKGAGLGAGFTYGAGMQLGASVANAGLNIASNAGLWFVLVALGVAIIEWFVTFGNYSLGEHVLMQLAVGLTAFFMFGKSNTDMAERIFGVFAHQMAFLFMFSAGNGFFQSGGFLAVFNGGLINNFGWIIFGLLIFGFLVGLLTRTPDKFGFVKHLLTSMFSPFIVLMLVGAVVFYFGSNPEFGLISGLFQIIQPLFVTIGALFWVLWGLSYAEESSKVAKIMYLAVILFLVGSLIHAIFSAEIITLGNGEIDLDVRGNALDVFTSTRQGATNLLDWARGNINQTRTEANQILNPGFESRVESQQGNQVGVTMESISGHRGEHLDTRKVVLISTVQGNTLDIPILLNLTCKAVNLREKEDVPGQVQRPLAFITSSQSHSFVCTFPENTLEAASYKAHMNASFNYLTSSYSRRYFVDQDRYLNLIQQQVDPFEQYGIPTQVPQSIFTPGPVELGIGTLNGLVQIPQGQDVVDDLRLFIQPRPLWGGSIAKVEYVYAFVPKPLSIRETNQGLDCQPFKGEKVEDPFVCADLDDCDNYNIYEFEIDSMKRIVLSCPLVSPGSNAVLGNQPISIESFRAIANYTYTIGKEVSFTVKESKEASESSVREGFSPYITYDQDKVQTGQEEKDTVPDFIEHGLTYGLIKLYNYDLDESVGCARGACGITQFTPEMYEQFAPDDAPELNEEFSPEISVQITDAALAKYYKDCESASYRNECTIAKYQCGERFTYTGQPEDYNQCLDTNACFYCIDTVIPSVMSYASGFAGSGDLFD